MQAKCIHRPFVLDRNRSVDTKHISIIFKALKALELTEHEHHTL
jgi:hypothetical protein